MRAGALVTDRASVELQVNDSIALFSKLRMARQLRVSIGGFSLEFVLDGGDEVLTALTECALKQTRARRDPKARNSSFDLRTASIAADVREEAVALVTNIISYVGLADSQMVPPGDDVPGLPIDVGWKAGLVLAGCCNHRRRLNAFKIS